MGKHGKCDVEACYPAAAGEGMYMIESPRLRWAFIRKVYVIVAVQLLLTVAVAATINLVEPIKTFFQGRTPAVIAAYVAIILSPLIIMLPMIYFRNKHPINLFFLLLFTVCTSASVGLGCLSKNGTVILQAAGITFVVVVGLTCYTFWAAKKGYDFEFLGPFLVAASLVLFLYAMISIFLPMGRTGKLMYGCVGALVFSGFIIYDTDNLIKRYTYDEYIAAAITLYLDIINLFMALVTLLQAADG
ncbi:protein LIFEGUARD 4-like [Oryza brachyantha]|uniref:protein LIFEGUARD 4-like n=1 Tax=Oryza brachyantha TaxID=4533 RepID=UPI001ADB6509|nr:protein LIFEGUARD 4-like [Oryza brachyantha]